MSKLIYNCLQNEKNLEQIFNNYADALIVFINGYIKNISEAEDIMMDCFVEIIIRDLDFESERQFKSYLYTCAKNKSLNYLRKEKHLVPIDNEVLIDQENVENKVFTDAKNKKLYEAMDQLKVKYKQVLYLFYIQGFSQEETAQILGMSDKALKNLKFRAKKRLNSILKKENFIFE